MRTATQVQEANKAGRSFGRVVSFLAQAAVVSLFVSTAGAQGAGNKLTDIQVQNLDQRRLRFELRFDRPLPTRPDSVPF